MKKKLKMFWFIVVYIFRCFFPKGQPIKDKIRTITMLMQIVALIFMFIDPFDGVMIYLLSLFIKLLLWMTDPIVITTTITKTKK